MNKFLLSSVLLLVPLLMVGALDNTEQFEAGINAAREVYYSGSARDADVSQLDNLLESLNTTFQGSSDAEYYRLSSEISLYKGLLLIDLAEEARASDVLAQGIELCATQYETDDDLFFLIQGALLKSHWMLLQKTRILIKTGGEVKDMTDLALTMNADDFTARLLSAQGLINAPALFGGDPVEAVRLLSASESLARNEYDQFDLYLTLADARRKKKAWDDAAEWCTKALSIFPENSSALEMKDLIGAKKK